MVTILRRCSCGSAYTQTIGGVRVCDTCAMRARALAAVRQAETLRQIGSQLTGQHVYRAALFAGAASLERDAANIEHVAELMRGHEGPSS